MKIIFLDIDGVLNSGNYIKRDDVEFDNPHFQIDPDAMVRLNRITQLTGASIVVTSTWRLTFRGSRDPLRQLQTCLTAYKIAGEVIDMTGIVSGGRRYEIQEWLDNHPGTESYLVIDDGVIEGFPGHTIKTSFDDGLQDKHIQEAIKILGM